MKLKNNEINISISDGNRKTGEITALSLTPGKTCSKEACQTCFIDGCYAFKSYRMYPSVRKAWDGNTEAVKNTEAFENLMNAYFDSMNAPRFFRIHVAGDFLSREYASAWARIAEKHPHTSFLAFTKQWDNVRNINFPENFSLVLSGWKGVTIPDDLKELYPIADCIEKGDKIPENYLECPGHCDSCGMCWHLKNIGKNVAFRKH